MVEYGTQLPPKELSVERIRQFFSRHEIDREELNRARRLVASGIDLRTNVENKFFDYCPTTLVAINEAIANGIYFASRYLETPFPDIVGFMENGEGVPSIDDKELTLAISNVSTEFPNGFIHFSAPYLASIANGIEGMGSGKIYSKGNFLSLAPHEMFHFFQLMYFPEQIAGDHLAYEVGGVDGWNDTISERQADEFGINFALAQQLPPL
jgi:hypothetical protein